MNIPVHVIIVTHNSSDVLQLCVNHLNAQTHSVSSITIVDSGSHDSRYIDCVDCLWPLYVIKESNIGFGRSNNLGFQEVQDKEGAVVFLNPDTFLPPDFLSDALRRLMDHPSVAILSGKLLGFDLDTMQGTGRIDSTGIFRRWYGRWYDRGQGKDDQGQYPGEELVPALCGALMVCRIEAFKEDCGKAFDPDFFLYKEDIELSIRLRKRGWGLLYCPQLKASHCRGWSKKRQTVPYDLRIMAAKNEVLLYKKHPSMYMLWALVKLFLVKSFHI